MKISPRIVIVPLLLALLPALLFAYNPNDRFVDVATAQSDIGEREQEIQRLESENQDLVKKIAENEDYLKERQDKLEKVETAVARMNEAIADMLRIMDDMTDKTAAGKFQQSIDESRKTRNNLMETRTKLENQIVETGESLDDNRLQLNINRAKVVKLNGEIEIINTQIARTNEQQKKLDFTIQEAEKALADIRQLVSDIGSVD
jgi:chromosome segregation ATPase